MSIDVFLHDAGVPVTVQLMVDTGGGSLRFIPTRCGLAVTFMLTPPPPELVLLELELLEELEPPPSEQTPSFTQALGSAEEAHQVKILFRKLSAFSALEQ